MMSINLIIVLFSVLYALWAIQIVKCDSKSNAKSLIETGLMLTDRLTQSSIRGTTSSQVIEYNPRNIALMTLLNSMLILGGLLGTVSRNQLGSPFKRGDFFKKRLFSHRKRFGSKKTAQPQHYLPQASNVPLIYNEPVHDPKSLHIVPPFTDIGNEIEIHPRTPIELRSGRRYDLVNEDNKPQARCGHVLQCFDTNGKMQIPKLSELTKLTIQLLNDKSVSRKKTELMDKIKEMVEIEQKSTCHFNFICQKTR